MENNLSDVKISGVGTISGGRYNEVRSSGSSKIDGDIECNSFKCSGSSTANGNIKAKIVEISGATKILKNVDTEDITVSGSTNILGSVTTGNARFSGSAHVQGDVNAKKIKISGSGHIDGSLHTDIIKISGTAAINGDCEAETFDGAGSFNIGGLLNAGDINIDIYGKCSVRDIGGENIKIQLGKYHPLFNIASMFLGYKGLVTNVIEGDNIYLESTTAKIVRGNNITIGPDCTIDTIEYRNKVNMDSNSKSICKKID